MNECQLPVGPHRAFKNLIALYKEGAFVAEEFNVRLTHGVVTLIAALVA